MMAWVNDGFANPSKEIQGPGLRDGQTEEYLSDKQDEKDFTKGPSHLFWRIVTHFEQSLNRYDDRRFRSPTSAPCLPAQCSQLLNRMRSCQLRQGRSLLLGVGGRARVCGGWVASYASPAQTDAQQRNALYKCLPSPSLLALFEDSYLVANMNCSGHERGSADGENRLVLVNHHDHTL